MPRRPPIDPEGIYHVGSRGCYGQPLFRTRDQHELFLRIYSRLALKHGWITLAWALMPNHHHLVIQLTDGGLSEGMRVLHGSFSRRIHAIYGMTKQGHLVRHGFFARRLESDGDVIGTCAYVDSNHSAGRDTSAPLPGDWCGYAATLGLVHGRPFHSPGLLLELCGRRPSIAGANYQRIVQEAHARRRQDLSPNDGYAA